MIINPSVRKCERSLLEKYRKVEPATIGHTVSFGFSTEELRASIPDMSAIGNAVTVRVPSIDSTLCHKVPEMVGPGDILVIDRVGDTRYACLGAGVATALKYSGVEAVIVDGAVTDIGDIRRMGLLVFYRRLSALTTRILGIDGEINVPVNCCGAVINPGDIVVADENGFVALDPAGAIPILDEALEEQEKEVDQFARIRSGTPLASISSCGRVLREKYGIE